MAYIWLKRLEDMAERDRECEREVSYETRGGRRLYMSRNGLNGSWIWLKGIASDLGRVGRRLCLINVLGMAGKYEGV